jgi:hypothetical protein
MQRQKFPRRMACFTGEGAPLGKGEFDVVGGGGLVCVSGVDRWGVTIPLSSRDGHVDPQPIAVAMKKAFDVEMDFVW